MANRIFEMHHAEESAIVQRVLIRTHQAIDAHFPSAGRASRQFTKTLFTAANDRTVADRAPLGSADAGAAVPETKESQRLRARGRKQAAEPRPEDIFTSDPISLSEQSSDPKGISTHTGKSEAVAKKSLVNGTRLVRIVLMVVAILAALAAVGFWLYGPGFWVKFLSGTTMLPRMSA